MSSIRNISAFVALIVLLSACSSNIPLVISDPLLGAPSLPEVQSQASGYVGQQVRWGGIILSTENRQDDSRITIVAFPLNDWGRPKITALSPGRFIAVVDEFLEPMVYSSDREITLSGRILGTETLKVGEFAYEYPLVQVENYHLWPTRLDSPNLDARRYWRQYPNYPFYLWPHNYKAEQSICLFRPDLQDL